MTRRERFTFWLCDWLGKFCQTCYDMLAARAEIERRTRMI
jgi:hypothetical protein